MKNRNEITIYDIAKHLNISASTVSRGLNENPNVNIETRKKIIAVAKEMGYRQNTVASNLRRKKTKTIGVVLPRFNSYFMSTVIAGMEKVANQAGYNLIISQSQESYKKEAVNINTMYNSRVDGLLVSLAYDTESLDHFKLFLKRNIPIIFFDRVYECPNCTSIVIDNLKAGYEATKHLIEQGCKKIVYLGGNLKRNVYKDRFEGYKKAMNEYGMQIDEELVMISMLNEQAGIDTAEKILQMKNRPDGIFATNDTTAVAVMYELKHAGVKIPEEIAVVGFNNIPISRIIDPNLSTINYPGEEMGEIAALTLINKLDNDQNDNLSSIVLNHELIIRESSKRR